VQKHEFIDPYKLVTDTIIEQLEKGVVPWRRPWRRDVGMPRNFTTGKEYHGINVILLNCRRFASPYWMTWNQIKARGGNVLKGEKASLVVKYGTFKKKVANAKGTNEEKKGYYLRGYRVFNALQTKGVEFPVVPSVPQAAHDIRLARAEEVFKLMPAPPRIQVGVLTEASYLRAADIVNIPAMGNFETPEAFYGTLFHELVHATGHESRLNRKTVVENEVFGGKVYSEEELVAEMGAAFLATEADIVRDEHEQSAAYLQSWIKVLGKEDNRRWIVRAANQAGKAVDFILGRSADDSALAAASEQRVEQPAQPIGA
jgi:antirestriction protein ArdC